VPGDGHPTTRPVPDDRIGALVALLHAVRAVPTAVMTAVVVASTSAGTSS